MTSRGPAALDSGVVARPAVRSAARALEKRAPCRLDPVARGDPCPQRRERDVNRDHHARTSPICTMARRSVSSASATSPTSIRSEERVRVCPASALCRAASSGWRSASLRVSREESGVPRRDLERDLGRRVGSVVTRAVNAPRVGHPVALGEHADRLRPARARRIHPIGGDIPFVRAERAAGGFFLARSLARLRAEACELVERDVVVRESRRARLAGDPVDVAAGARIEGCSQARRRAAAMAVRQRVEDKGRGVGREESRLGRGLRARRRELGRLRSSTPARRTASTRCGACAGSSLAAAASAAIILRRPARSSALPWPQPSETTSTTIQARHFSQSSRLGRTPSAPDAQARSFARSSSTARRSRIGPPGLSLTGSTSRRPNGTSVANRAKRGSDSSSPAPPKSRSRFPQSSRASVQRAHSSRRRAPPAGSPGAAAMGEACVGAEHPIEEARGVRAHELPQAVR